LPQFIDVGTEDSRCEPEDPKKQEKQIVAEHRYEEDQEQIIIFVYLFLNEKHTAK
jgi:hypothetical protein